METVRTDLSERLVRKYGVVFMGGMVLLMLFISGGSVEYLIINSINVFLTVTLSQFDMTLERGFQGNFHEDASLPCGWSSYL